MYDRKESSKGLVLVTGGAGYVGSHTVVELLNADFDVVCLDNCVNAIRNDKSELPESLKRVQEITGRHLVDYVDSSLLDEQALDQLFAKYKFNAVIHFAGLKAVGESCQQPLRYYRNNVAGTLNLLQAMSIAQVGRLIFSSSCTVYGAPKYLPVDENHPTGQQIINPYGRTKFMIEEILKDCALAENNFGVTSLRYFNPIGSHESGLIGEDPQGVPNNLMPYITQVAVGRLPHLNVYGSDFDTVDGTGVRDYIHIMDLAKGHVLALNKMIEKNWTGFHPINIGTGRGYSVLELIQNFEKANNVKIVYKIVDRRPGDIGCVYADACKANDVLGWKAEYSVEDMCKHVWKWQSNNPNGFQLTNVQNGKNISSNGVQKGVHSNALVHDENVIKSKDVSKSVGNDSEPNNNIHPYQKSAQYQKIVN